MKYFAIESSLNEKIMGKIPQVKHFIHNCHNDNPDFIDNFRQEKINIDPILSNAVLHKKAKKTDMINTMGDVGSVFGYLISDKFKELLDKANCYGIQYFKTYIIQNEEVFNNYWQINLFDFPFQFIDFEKIEFILKDRDINREVTTEEIHFKDIEDFKLFTSEIRYPKYIFIKNIIFNEKMNLDFFVLKYTEGGQRGIVSEKLKFEMEKNDITGIEFRPFEMNIYEWFSKGGLREQIYGRTFPM